MGFYVNLWGSHPDEENDDCWTGVRFDTLDAAKQAASNPATFPWPSHCSSHDTAALQVTIEDEHTSAVEEVLVVMNPAFRPDPEAAEERSGRAGPWRREMQREDAMLYGVEGWNQWEGQ